mmetsp:Transcript_11095/g.22307  ORF Transcript_11095/g.22307 Transcript_11095/m.22307 type:complete len:255 (+) Transcript_11095:366-1130(+)
MEALCHLELVLLVRRTATLVQSDLGRLRSSLLALSLLTFSLLLFLLLLLLVSFLLLLNWLPRESIDLDSSLTKALLRRILLLFLSGISGIGRRCVSIFNRLRLFRRATLVLILPEPLSNVHTSILQRFMVVPIVVLRNHTLHILRRIGCLFGKNLHVLVLRPHVHIHTMLFQSLASRLGVTICAVSFISRQHRTVELKEKFCHSHVLLPCILKVLSFVQEGLRKHYLLVRCFLLQCNRTIAVESHKQQCNSEKR